MNRKILFACLLSVASPAFATAESPAPQDVQATTRLVRFAGALTDAAGAPLSGVQTVTFTLYDAGEGGTALWTETLTVTADERGRYAVLLGSTAALPQNVFTSEQARWVGTNVSGRELERSALVAVPYALKAVDADTLGGKPASSFVTTNKEGNLQRADGTAFVDGTSVDGTGVPGQIAKWATPTTLSSSVISESASNRVGFGLTDPTGGGVVDSVFTIRNYDNNTGFGILNETLQRRFAINTLFNGGWLMYDGGSGAWLPGIGQYSGRVGIDNPTPQADLHVKSGTAPATLRLDGPVNSGAGPRIRWSEATVNATYAGVGFEGAYDPVSNSLIFRAYDGTGILHDNNLVLERDGNVGIGTVDPVDRLHVVGEIRVGTGATGCVKDADGTVIAGTCASDFRFKKNIAPFAYTLGKLAQLQPVHFDWRADEFPDRSFGASRSFGLIAQDVEAVLPELVATDDKGFKAVKYSELPLHMLQAIKELKGENDSLKQLLNAQELLLKAQEERLRKLEAAIK